MPTFPNKIYVRWEPVAHESPYLAASRFVNGEDGEKVAIYVLTEVKTISAIVYTPQPRQRRTRGSKSSKSRC
jgi:hypothetical protein